MKRFVAGVICGVLMLLAAVALADQAPIRLVVDGRVLAMDVQPQLINGRVMIPARFLAEALGATVEWDQENQSVVITSKEATVKSATLAPAEEWIGVLDLIDQVGGSARQVETGGKYDMIVEVLGQSITCPLGPDGPVVCDLVNGGNLKGRMNNRRLELLISDLRNVGFLPADGQ